mgnify:CR=1 FL=1
MNKTTQTKLEIMDKNGQWYLVLPDPNNPGHWLTEEETRVALIGVMPLPTEKA